MTDQELKKLRRYYHSLRGIQRSIDNLVEHRWSAINRTDLVILTDEVNRLNIDFPESVPLFNPDIYCSKATSGSYYVSGIQSYLSMAVGILHSMIEVVDITPITESREFSFVNDFHLRKTLERDYAEMQRAFISKCWKSVIILSGSAIEAILLDLLTNNSSLALSANNAPAKNKTNIGRWTLAELIDVAVELRLVSSGLEKLSHSVREYRNLVHPGNEIRNGLAFDEEEARIALEVLHMLHRDLSP